MFGRGSEEVICKWERGMEEGVNSYGLFINEFF